ncbi:conserved membrane protein of unknown function [Candidatus Filomicrobium marinum]|uniref:Transmembrane protein n=1 Tax=Candidatus Filomicrobium marinum TaxID=1608628 RepID=A0A0D6JHN4_9HYPH|nr:MULTISPECIES: hypothetical protein [Filomicrobium]MCV0369655.1 hypothetical protein [Filomicrobium sp.]CFX47187.1 conserved membrane protein of unknown function [Candidatus Filomicrobium marinum]CPR20564.1 conserved membrane protein of unknown function [Candidatus Filomicrobium marinum]
MIPTLSGRWQTRILLYVVLGLPITALYASYLGLDEIGRYGDPFVFLTALLLVGLGLDYAYIQIQRFRWDNDWPFAFQFFFSIVEFLIVLGLMNIGLLDPFLVDRIPADIATTQFLLIFIPSFFAVLGGIQIFLIRWRFKGGELGRH